MYNTEQIQRNEKHYNFLYKSDHLVKNRPKLINSKGINLIHATTNTTHNRSRCTDHHRSHFSHSRLGFSLSTCLLALARYWLLVGSKQ